jgi:hypothetical protein
MKSLCSRIAIGAIVSLMLVTGCQKDRAEATRDPLDENYKLIDRGDYSQAIEKLQILSRKDRRPQVRLALASAFAARGGIRVEQYWGFVVGFKAPLVTPESRGLNASVESLQRIAKQAKGDLDPRDMKALGGLVNALAVWDRYKERVDSIPVVRGAAKEDLKIAVETLNEVQTPGGRLYRGILNLVLFKSAITESANFWEDFNKVLDQLIDGKLDVLCQFKFETLEQWLTPISYHLAETLGDLAIAYPEDKKELLDARQIVQGIYSTTMDAVKELRQKRTCQ